MFARLSRHVVRGVPAANAPRLPRSFAVTRVAVQRQNNAFSTTADGKPPSNPKQPDNDALPKMDPDAMEAVVKNWFGDQANWSHEKLKNLLVSDPLLPPHEQLNFGDIATGSLQHEKSQPSTQFMTEEEFGLLLTPVHRWSEGPSNIQDDTCQDILSPLFGGPVEGSGLKHSPMTMSPARLLPLRAKLWQGMAPMTRDRWLDKRMDDPANHRNLMELMNDILTIFRFYNHEEVMKRMRAAFEFLVDKYNEFAVPVNARREKRGIQKKLDMAALWAEYFDSRMTIMANRTHQWLVDRVDEVQSRAFAEYTTALEAAGTDQEAIGHAGRRYYECIQDLNSMITKVDYTLAIPMGGFKGYTPYSRVSDVPLEVRKTMYMKLMATKSWKHAEKFVAAQDEASKTETPPPKNLPELVESMKKGPQPAPLRFRDTETLIGHYHEGKQNRAEIRKELRGPPPAIREEQWITLLKQRMEGFVATGRDPTTRQWGFICYRLTYKQTDAEWAAFLDKLYADFRKPGNGVWIEGYESIADKAGLIIYDGRDFDIPENDIEAAKRHFMKGEHAEPTMLMLGSMWSQDFLVIDAQSYSSYMNAPADEEVRPPPPFGPCFGDRGGFVRLVDTVEYPPGMLEELSPGYRGDMKVLTSLVFQEVYPLLATFAARPTMLWPLARLHPREVYVGHTVESQEAWWEFTRTDTAVVMQAMFADMRKKKEMGRGQ
ncbi:hypothetical protein BKA63DRAFT_130404 [Paraphoma chrysanthemicola]|nr:hypothetical protein BKA63DRAFT_130404 [Paraphoma chrysanthemicola]